MRAPFIVPIAVALWCAGCSLFGSFGADGGGPCDGAGCTCEYEGRREGVCSSGRTDESDRLACLSPLDYYSVEANQCDGLDNDCDGATDEGCLCQVRTGLGICAVARRDNAGVCLTPERYEGAESLCDGYDNDCDGTTDEGCPTCTYLGIVEGVCLFGAAREGSESCDPPPNWSEDEADCTADLLAGDGVDNDCDGEVDEGCGTLGETRTCGRDERVSSGECVACAPGMTNEPGDDTSGEDTACAPIDPCAAALGASCSWIEGAYLKASNVAPDDFFGWAVSLSGDRLAVAAHHEDGCAAGANGDQADDACERAGAVYLFERSAAGVWSQQAYLKASNPGEEDRFGNETSLSDDRLAVSAQKESSCASGTNGDQTDDACAEAGAVYLFERSAAGAWSQRAYLKASNPGADDRFGWSLSLSGDRLAVGAQHEDGCAAGTNGDACAEAGAVYLFERSAAGAWSQRAYLKASNLGVDDQFGSAISIHHDHLIVGAYREDGCARGVGGAQPDDACNGAGATYSFGLEPR